MMHFAPAEKAYLSIEFFFHSIVVVLRSLWINIKAKWLGQGARSCISLDLSGKVCVCTGSESGLGLATCKLLAARGAHIIMTCLSLSAGEQAAKAVRAVQPAGGCSRAVVELQQLDLGSLASVRRFSRGFNARGLPLHMLVCNAGVLLPPGGRRRVSQDGLELHFQVNCLAHWLLAHELLEEQMRRRKLNPAEANGLDSQGGGKPSCGESVRLIMVTSEDHARCPRIPLEDLQSERGAYTSFQCYALSKLAIVLLAKEFQRRLDRDVVVAVHPGNLRTQLSWDFGMSGMPSMMRPLLEFVFRWVLVDPEFGAWNTLHVAAAPAAEVRGRYFYDCREVAPSKVAEDETVARLLWDRCCQLAKVENSISLPGSN